VSTTSTTDDDVDACLGVLEDAPVVTESQETRRKTMHRRRRREEEPLWLRLAPFLPLMSWSGRPDKDTGSLKQLWRVLLFTPIVAWSLIVVADSRIVMIWHRRFNVAGSKGRSRGCDDPRTVRVRSFNATTDGRLFGILEGHMPREQIRNIMFSSHHHFAPLHRTGAPVRY
jgi:hypothetical protein